MNTKSLQKTLKEKPFQPFRLHLADGEKIFVGHPEYMVIAPAERTVVVWERDESYHVIDILMITQLAFPGKAEGKEDPKTE